MDQYEKNIGLKTIYTTLVRRFHIILIIFIPVAIAAFVVTNFMLTKTYISNVTMSRSAVISTAQYSVMQRYIQDTSTDETKPGAIYTTVMNLKENGVKHSDGSEITISDIESGLSFTVASSNTSTDMKISYQNTDSTVTQAILIELSEISVKYIIERAGAEYASLTITSPASTPSKNSKEQTYFLVALAADLVVACGVPFVYEIIADEVYDKEDVRNLGADSFELKVSSK